MYTYIYEKWEYMCVYIYLNHLAVPLKLIQYCQ